MYQIMKRIAIKNQMPHPSYYGPLQSFLSYIDNTEYEKRHEHSEERLREITPKDIERWMNWRLFDCEDPAEDARPKCRANSVAFWKKALSAFMPNKLMVWNEISEVGNPTKSVLVNQIVDRVKKAEARKLGVPSQARRSATSDEHQKTIALVRNQGKDLIWKYGVPAQLNYQFHMIARLDDTMNTLEENIQCHPQFNFALMTKLSWSKNVREERDAPWQIMLGSYDSDFCVLIALAIWLEVKYQHLTYAKHSPYLFAFSDDTRFPEGGKTNKARARKIYGDKLFKENGLQGAQDGERGGGLGTHSTRKHASTHVRKQGITKDDKDQRGRWKSTKRVSDRYDDIELPWVDAKVAASLCIGGPCKYKLIDKDITESFILQHCVPKMQEGI